MSRISKIEVITGMSKLTDLIQQLSKVGIRGVTVMQVLGCGVEMGTQEYEVDINEVMELLPKQQINIVVETSKVDDSKDLKAAFVYGSYKANGDIFEEFYYNLDSMTINKVRPSGKTYTVGDEIPVNGESYSYPDDFDIVVLRDKVAVKVRDRMVVGIGSLDEYGYSDVPVINGRGFAVKIADEKDLKAFKFRQKRER